MMTYIFTITVVTIYMHILVDEFNEFRNISKFITWLSFYRYSLSVESKFIIQTDSSMNAFLNWVNYRVYTCVTILKSYEISKILKSGYGLWVSHRWLTIVLNPNSKISSDMNYTITQLALPLLPPRRECVNASARGNASIYFPAVSFKTLRTHCSEIVSHNRNSLFHVSSSRGKDWSPRFVFDVPS